MTRHTFGYNDPERQKWQDPEHILRHLGLKQGSTFIDVGCGEGFFALPAAEMTAPNGNVLALDINPQAITALRKEATKRKLTNITAITGRAEETILCESCADFIFFGIVLHDFADPHRVLANARTMIKPQGRLVDLDWKKESMNFGPPVEIRFSEPQATQLIESQGFKTINIEPLPPYNYLITAQPTKT